MRSEMNFIGERRKAFAFRCRRYKANVKLLIFVFCLIVSGVPLGIIKQYIENQKCVQKETF